MRRPGYNRSIRGRFYPDRDIGAQVTFEKRARYYGERIIDGTLYVTDPIADACHTPVRLTKGNMNIWARNHTVMQNMYNWMTVQNPTRLMWTNVLTRDDDIRLLHQYEINTWVTYAQFWAHAYPHIVSREIARRSDHFTFDPNYDPERRNATPLGTVPNPEGSRRIAQQARNSRSQYWNYQGGWQRTHNGW